MRDRIVCHDYANKKYGYFYEIFDTTRGEIIE